jgi:hypothetical protein
MILLNGKSNISPFIRLSDFSYKIKCYVSYFYLSQNIEYRNTWKAQKIAYSQDITIPLF